MSTLRIAIVGAGPSGFYAAETLFKCGQPVIVDIFDRLITPYGLLRGGVAPDHQQMKSVSRAYERIITANPTCTYIGNVCVGKDVSLEDLRSTYHAAIFTTGAQSDKSLGIPGELATGSTTATEFVGWYNAHPDYRHYSPKLDSDTVVIIGHGNVAIDVARILSKTPDELAKSDITENALNHLRRSQIKNVILVGRRGPAQAAFTELEIKELGELSNAVPLVNKDDLHLNPESQAELQHSDSIKIKKTYPILQKYSNNARSTPKKSIEIRFFESPVKIIETDGIVSGIELEKNQLTGPAFSQKAIGTGQTITIPCGMVLRSVGYFGVPIPDLPFDTKRGIIPNQSGQITENGEPLTGLYCAGWVKRGPSGVIGTNRSCAIETVRNLLATVNSDTEPPQTREELFSKIANSGIQMVHFSDWKKIDIAEIKRGESLGKPREKFADPDEMLKIINSQDDSRKG